MDLLQYDSAPGAQAAGEYFTGMTFVTQNTIASDFVSYELELVVTAVPVPAALWLFISGLIALVGFKRSCK